MARLIRRFERFMQNLDMRSMFYFWIIYCTVLGLPVLIAGPSWWTLNASLMIGWGAAWAVQARAGIAPGVRERYLEETAGLLIRQNLEMSETIAQLMADRHDIHPPIAPELH